MLCWRVDSILSGVRSAQVLSAAGGDLVLTTDQGIAMVTVAAGKPQVSAYFKGDLSF